MTIPPINKKINKLYYILPFSISAQGGKSLGSRNKYESLSKIFNVKLVAPKSNSIIYRICFLIYIEIYMLFVVIFSFRNRNVFFSRGMVGFFASIYLKFSDRHVFLREIHAAPGEYKVLNGSMVKKLFTSLYEKGSYFIDSLSDLRIFNHPYLYSFYKNNGMCDECDIILYNGAKLNKNSFSKLESIKLLNLNPNKKILVFTGSVSSWHGIDNLVRLQTEFNNNGDNVQIVVGGGKIPNLIENNIYNIFPLDEVGCNHLINSADACLLPIENNRVSPGSPLKLYQYLLASKPVITQKDVVGYADEVSSFKAGISVDFDKPSKVRMDIINFIKNDLNKITTNLEKNKLNMGITWDDRVNEIANSIYNHHKLN